MNNHFFLAVALVLNCAPINAQSKFDSTGGNRLWAPNAPPVTFPGIDVPGYGRVTEGSVLSSFRRRSDTGNTCFAMYEFGICTAKNGGGGYWAYTHPIGTVQYCPANTIVSITGNHNPPGSICDGN